MGQPLPRRTWGYEERLGQELGRPLRRRTRGNEERLGQEVGDS